MLCRRILTCVVAAWALLGASAAPAASKKGNGTLTHLNNAIDKGDVQGAEHALQKLESKSSEKAAQTEQMVLDKVQKETQAIQRAKTDAAHTSAIAKAALAVKKKNPAALKVSAKQMLKTKKAIRNAKVADAQRAVARLSRKDAESQVAVLHEREKDDELKVKAAENTAAEEKRKGDAAVSKLSTELKKEKLEVEKAKAEAAHEMRKSEEVDEQTGFSNHLTKKQIKVKKDASKHVAKAKARVAKGYNKMKQAESDAALKVHKYEHIKEGLMDAESQEMHSKQVEAQKMKSLSKAKAIERQQEAKLKAARKKAAEETRNALYVAFGKQGLTNAVASPLRKELAAALQQEKTQAKQIAHLQSLESQAQAKLGHPATEGSQCESSSKAVSAYDKCIASCTKAAGNWYGAPASCSCFKCRQQLEVAMHASCSCHDGSPLFQQLCPRMRSLHNNCLKRCNDESEHCMCGHTASSCCAAKNIQCESGFFWEKKCVLGHPYGYVCNTKMTTFTLGVAVVISALMAAILYGCLPTVVAWYCCIRNGGQFTWLFGSPKVYGKDDDL